MFIFLMGLVGMGTAGAARQPNQGDPSGRNRGIELRVAQTIVSVGKGRFAPAVVTVKVGESVLWVNDDDREHTVDEVKGAFSSGKLKPKQTYSRRFMTAGTYNYACRLHPREKGQVVVVKAPDKK